MAGRKITVTAVQVNGQPDAAGDAANKKTTLRDQALAVLHTAREPDEAMAAAGDKDVWRNMVEAAIAQRVD